MVCRQRIVSEIVFHICPARQQVKLFGIIPVISVPVLPAGGRILRRRPHKQSAGYAEQRHEPSRYLRITTHIIEKTPQEDDLYKRKQLEYRQFQLSGENQRLLMSLV